ERSEAATEKEGGKWSSYQYLGRTGSAIPTASLPGTEVSVEEIRTAVQDIVYQGGYGGEYGGTGTTTDFQRQILDEVVIQELLIDHVGHGCCWGSHPARTWKIHTVEDCNVYLGGNIDGKDNGPELGIWELDLRSQFPLLFTSYEESRAKIPHSETIEKCSGCDGRGNIVCLTCNANQEPRFYKENQMAECPAYV
ncbi:hypothetical protein CFP56_025814, partial [Quercus suber]